MGGAGAADSILPRGRRRSGSQTPAPLSTGLVPLLSGIPGPASAPLPSMLHVPALGHDTVTSCSQPGDLHGRHWGSQHTEARPSWTLTSGELRLRQKRCSRGGTSFSPLSRTSPFRPEAPAWPDRKGLECRRLGSPFHGLASGAGAAPDTGRRNPAPNPGGPGAAARGRG